MPSFRARLIRLAHTDVALRPFLLPLLREAAADPYTRTREMGQAINQAVQRLSVAENYAVRESNLPLASAKVRDALYACATALEVAGHVGPARSVRQGASELEDTLRRRASEQPVNKIDHGYAQPLAGGTDVMKRLQDQLLIEQGRSPREPNPRLAFKK